MPITALPTPPTRSDPANFSDRADAFLGALPDFATEANDLATDVNSKQISAVASASAASASQIAAASSAEDAASSAAVAATYAGASIWVSGQTYAIGDVRWSPITGNIYRRLTAGSGTTDPSADGTNWVALVPWGASVPLTSATTLIARTTYHVDTTGGEFEVNLPLNHSAEDWVILRDVARNCSLANLTINGNGTNIYSAVQNYKMDVNGETLMLVIDATRGWIRA